jgi:hypothetical protein
MVVMVVMVVAVAAVVAVVMVVAVVAVVAVVMVVTVKVVGEGEGLVERTAESSLGRRCCPEIQAMMLYNPRQ